MKNPLLTLVMLIGILVPGIAKAQTDVDFADFPASQAVDYPGGIPRMGTVKNVDGTVTFCFAAPEKTTVMIVPSWDEYQPLAKNVMNYQDYEGNRYFWITIDGLDNETPYPYYFWVDGKYKVGDPYAHLILDPVDVGIKKGVWDDRPAYPSGISGIMLGVYQGNLDDYEWECTDFVIPPHESLVIYELLIRDFTGRNKMADGTIRAAMEKIPYLKELGINAIELMPIMQFKSNNSWGYNPNFYMAPDKSYGSPDNYKAFIDECHRNGIAVILDIVLNHCDGNHPWYLMYDIKNSPFHNQKAPHDASVLNDWKQENPLVQQQWHDALKYWLTAYNVDGFRFDLVKGLGETYGSNSWAYNESRIKVVKGLQAAIKEVKPDGIHINEGWVDNSEEIVYGEAGQMNWSNVSYNARQYAMGYTSSSVLNGFNSTNWKLPVGAAVNYAESHDEQRMAYDQQNNGAAGVKGVHDVSMKRLGSVAAQMLMTPGAKMIWMFGELGADESTKNSNGTDNNTGAKKVHWDYLDDPDRMDLYHTYCDLNAIRNANPDMFGKDVTCAHKSYSNSANMRAILLTNGDKQIATFVNPKISGSGTYNLTVSVIDENVQVLAATPGFTPQPTFANGKLTCEIPANSFAVFGTANIETHPSGIDEIVNDIDKSYAWAYVEDGCIRIAGDYKRVVVCNLAGRMAAIDTLLPAGVYIVNIDGRATKLLVK